MTDTETTRPRGRPRPDETMDRDDTIEKLLQTRGAMTRNEIADELELTTTLTYLSLDRLRRQGRAKKCAGTGSNTLWTSEATAPCP